MSSIASAVRRDLSQGAYRQRVIDAAKNGGPEFCVSCYLTLGYPALTTHIHDPKRWKDGAYYTEGCGQTCAICAQEENNSGTPEGE